MALMFLVFLGSVAYLFYRWVDALDRRQQERERQESEKERDQEQGCA